LGAKATIAALEKKPAPAFPGMLAALGPGIVWLALAQGSGELIWWPYVIAKYGLGFLFLLIPACLLQYPVNYQIGTYTLLTGESIFQGFIRLNRTFALALWILATLSFLWFGAFASAGGTALARLTEFPMGWDPRGQALFWAYLSMVIFLSGIIFSRVIYNFIEKLMWGVSIVTIVGLLLACTHPKVLAAAPAFFKGVFIPVWPLPRPWEAEDATILLTAITFAGLGGFWTLFYSYWLREKKVGMAAYMGNVTGARVKEETLVQMQGYGPNDTDKDISIMRRWKKFLAIDSGVGVIGNLATTLMTCLLSYALLFPEGLLPEKYEIAVVQARFFELRWGAVGALVFLFVAAAFLADTWIATLDAVSRMHTDFLRNYFPRFAKKSFKSCYFFFIAFFSVVTALTMLFTAPGPLILLSAVIGFVGTVLFTTALLFLNYGVLPKLITSKLLPGKRAFIGLTLAAVCYTCLAGLYLWCKFLR